MKKSKSASNLRVTGGAAKIGNNEANTQYVNGKKAVKSSGGTGLNEQNSKYCKSKKY